MNIILTSFSQLLKDNITDTIFSLPKASAAIISLTKAGSTLFGMLIGWIGMGVSLVGYAFDWTSKQNKLSKHEAWAKMFTGSEKTAKQIYDKQRETFEKRLVTNASDLNRLLESINYSLESVKNGTPDEKVETLDKVIVRLKENGIEFLDIPKTLEQLQQVLSEPGQHEKLNVMMVKKKEMLSVSIRNSLKVFNQKKNEIDKGFLEKEQDKASGFLILYAYITGWSIALESLLATSVFTSALVITSLSTMLTVLGFGTTAGLVVSVILGSIYLHRKKPNLFKTYMQGIQAKLVFWNIPLSIQKFRKKCRLLEEVKVCGKINQIGNEILKVDCLCRLKDENKVKAYLSEHLSKKWFSGNYVEALSGYKEVLEGKRESSEAEFKSLSKKVLELNESISYLEEKIKPLQDKISEAGWKDFQLQLKREIEPRGDLRTLSECLLKDPTILQDVETKNILQWMGIDLYSLSSVDAESAINQVSSKIRTFFAMDEAEKMGMIKNNDYSSHPQRGCEE